MMASAPLTPPSTTSVPTTIKMEDLQVPFDTPSPNDSNLTTSEPSSTPAPSGSESRQVKKRKSWGQVLPEPKTSLPPRKRAKTEDEKEQRRIERVKRNRLAAHNSRERKRQEYELLQAEKDQMEADLQAYQHKMARMEAELKFYRKKYPGEAPEPVFDLTTSNDSLDTVCPARTSASFPSPISMDSMDSPRDSSCQPETPASTFEATPDFDSTQYPAAVLCDLQFDEKPVVLDNLFDFDQFPEGSPSAACVEPTTGLADPSSVDFFGSALFGHSSSSIPYGFPDGFDAKFSDLQSASGATIVSDEVLAAEF
ncbi:transcription factor that binds to CRE motif [Neocucurbitaria cava]|uniref:Transcription factor that binds to CRE motif n=1 Tax=Neocucurbitaria cava TaxID=798079 RepID=A0A9W8YGF6_9PLEO|nr:transcription factor that binds to CRE motif [Neocucurbitaria cava]